MQITKHLFFNFVMAGSSKGNTFEQYEIDAVTRPRFGRNWWYWKPAFTDNGGRFRSNENTDVSIYWLCFTVGLTLFARKKLK